ncbi:MAG: galactokinase [Planctomycetota bacterium]
MKAKPLTQQQFFGGRSARARVHASAPGRLDVMGGIADYSGSLVLQMPIAERTHVWLRQRTDGVVRIHSAAAERFHHPATVTLDRADLSPVRSQDETARFAAVRRRLAATPGGDWAAYVAGCITLLEDAGLATPAGADIFIDSQVPFGKGVSSSAALEVATLTALDRDLHLNLGRTQLPILAQRVENRLVGAPCGLMDQLATYLGRANRLLPILCQPDRVGTPVVLPRSLRFVGIDSGVRHAVSGSDYTSVRCAAFMGYSLIARAMGLPKSVLQRARTAGDRHKLPFGGYLANIAPSLFSQRFARQLPARMSAAAFHRAIGATIDPITRPKAGRSYAVAACTQHPIHECERVKTFVLLLEALNRLTARPTRASTNRSTRAQHGERRELLVALGERMFQSHASYSACGLGEPVTDSLVEAVREAGPAAGVYGAKITGGGSGGTVCVLCDGAQGLAAARRIAARIGRAHGCRLTMFEGSSEGARHSV